MSAFTPPTLAQVIEQTVEARLTRLNTCLPAEVIKVDVAAGKCDVQPLLKRETVAGEVISMPVITDVPIANYRAGKAFISLPVHVGDTVLLLFAQRSLDLWLTSGGNIDPRDPRKFHLSDAIAYPGIYPYDDAPTGAAADDIVIKNDVSKMTIKPTGKILFNGESEELMDLLIQLTTEVENIAATLNTTTTNTIFGPMQNNDFVFFGTTRDLVTAIKTKLSGLKG